MNPSGSRAPRACALLLACVWTGVAAAQDAAPPDALTLRDALALAAQRNPEIAAFASHAQGARQQVELQALRPPTTLEMQFENFAGTGDVSGARSLEATLQLSHVIELGGKAQLRRSFGSAELEQLDAAQRGKRADIFAEVARRFVHVLSDQEQLQSTQRATRLAEQARDGVQERIKAGATSPVFLSRAEITLARARIAQEHAEHELASSRVALAASWGEERAAFTEVRGDLFAFADIEPLATYAQRLDANPDLLKFSADARVLDARQRLAQSQRTPNVTLNAGVRRLEGIDDQAFVAGFSMPLGAARRAQPELLALNAGREQLQFSERARRVELSATLFGLYQETLHARAEAQALHEEIRPQAEAMLQTSDAGYRAGRFSLLELTDAQRQLLEIEQESIRAAAEFHTHLIEIERLTGQAVHALATR